MKKSLRRRAQCNDEAAVAAALNAPRLPEYHDWLDFHFGRLGANADPWDDPWQLEWEFTTSPTKSTALSTCAFVNCGTDLAGYSDAAVAVGLRVILEGQFSDVAKHIASDQVDELHKRAFIKSLRLLYSDCLSFRTAPVLGHLNETSGKPLESVTYMLWDMSPLQPLISIRDPFTKRSVLIDTLREILLMKPNNPACLESVLHGFGHFVQCHPAHRDEIVAAIDELLRSRPLGRRELVAYAVCARSGCVQ